MATYLQVVNYVLTRLREDEVSSVSSSAYSKLIGRFVNDAKREVEDAWRWTSLREAISVTTSSGTETYAVTGTSQRTKIYEVWDTTNDCRIPRIDHASFNTFKYGSVTSNNSPEYYRVRGVDSSGQIQIELHPIPNAAYSLAVYCKNPQAELSSDSTEITVPFYPIELGAWTKAISERGEDGGTLFDESTNMYRQAMADAIAQDSAFVDEEIVWEPG